MDTQLGVDISCLEGNRLEWEQLAWDEMDLFAIRPKKGNSQEKKSMLRRPPAGADTTHKAQVKHTDCIQQQKCADGDKSESSMNPSEDI